MRAVIDWLLCKLGRCRRCVVLSTDEGIGGQCLRCRRVHGWMTRAELRAALDRRWP